MAKDKHRERKPKMKTEGEKRRKTSKVTYKVY